MRDETRQHTFWCTDDLWEAASKAALLASHQEGEDVSRSELLRRGLRHEIERINRREDR